MSLSDSCRLFRCSDSNLKFKVWSSFSAVSTLVSHSLLSVLSLRRACWISFWSCSIKTMVFSVSVRFWVVRSNSVCNSSNSSSPCATSNDLSDATNSNSHRGQVMTPAILFLSDSMAELCTRRFSSSEVQSLLASCISFSKPDSCFLYSSLFRVASSTNWACWDFTCSQACDCFLTSRSSAVISSESAFCSCWFRFSSLVLLSKTLFQSVSLPNGFNTISIPLKHISSESSLFSSSWSSLSIPSSETRTSQLTSTWTLIPRSNSRLSVMLFSMAAIFSILLLARSCVLFSSCSICSASILIRPSTPANSKSASCNSFSMGVISSTILAMASSTTIPFEKRLIISFFSLSELDRKSS